jgi:CDP-glycerol glycerophosphotransferase
LSERFNCEFVFAYRLHPNIAQSPRPDFLQGLIDVSFYQDTQELLVATDVLLSDYSSILEDFMLTGRPGFVYAPDIASYNEDRGFYYPLKDRPFSVATDQSELVYNILNYNEDEYKHNVERFVDLIELYDDGNGDEDLAKIIYILAKSETEIDDAVDAVGLSKW